MMDTTGLGRGATGTVTEPVIVPTAGSGGSGGTAPATAVTVAAAVVVSVVWTMPFASVLAFVGVTVPEVVENPTGMTRSGLPDASVTTAVIVVLPPPNGTDAGLAVRATRPTAAVPTARLTGLARTFPEVATMCAVPDAAPAEKTTVACPALFVTTSAGSIVPSVVVNEIDAPTAGSPPPPRSSAVRTAVPLTETERVGVDSVKVEPDGAVIDSEAQLPPKTVSNAMPAS
jgi:hypothetical protein